MTVLDMIKEDLKIRGYDGLYNNLYGEDMCGCKIEDLGCCDEDMRNCSPGYLQECRDNCERKEYGCEWCIGEMKK